MALATARFKPRNDNGGSNRATPQDYGTDSCFRYVLLAVYTEISSLKLPLRIEEGSFTGISVPFGGYHFLKLPLNFNTMVIYELLMFYKANTNEIKEGNYTAN